MHLQHGMGFLLNPDGTQYHGKFENDIPHGRGRYLFSDGSKYDGNFERGCPKGYGFLGEPNGKRWLLRFEGGRSFKDGAVPVQKDEEPIEPARSSACPGLGICAVPNEIPQNQIQEVHYKHCKEVSYGKRIGRETLSPISHASSAHCCTLMCASLLTNRLHRARSRAGTGSACVCDPNPLRHAAVERSGSPRLHRRHVTRTQAGRRR
jgi:hypothetical protein